MMEAFQHDNDQNNSKWFPIESKFVLKEGCATRPHPHISLNDNDTVVQMKRANQCLQLENVLLERQLMGLLNTIKSNPQLEELFLSQLEIENKKKQTRLDFHSDPLP